MKVKDNNIKKTHYKRNINTYQQKKIYSIKTSPYHHDNNNNHNTNNHSYYNKTSKTIKHQSSQLTSRNIDNNNNFNYHLSSTQSTILNTKIQTIVNEINLTKSHFKSLHKLKPSLSISYSSLAVLRPLSSCKSKDLSRQMSQNFHHKTTKKHSIFPLEFDSIKQIKAKMANNYNKDLMDCATARENYQNSITYYKHSHEKVINQAKQMEKMFYENKKILNKQTVIGELPYDLINMSKIVFKQQKTKKICVKEEITASDNDIKKVKEKNNLFELTADINKLNKIIKQFQKENGKHLKGNSKKNDININKLTNRIRMMNIAKYNYDPNDDDMNIKNVPKLKKMIRNVQQDSQMILKNYFPVCMKKNFRDSTIKKFLSSTGKNL